jgi:hypothetical protein
MAGRLMNGEMERRLKEMALLLQGNVICLEGLEKHLSRITGFRTEIQTPDFPLSSESGD